MPAVPPLTLATHESAAARHSSSDHASRGLITPHADVVDGLDALDGLASSWADVYAASHCEPSTSFEWTRALARERLRQGDRTLLVRVWRGPRLVGLLPLFARTSWVLRLPYVVLMPLSEIKNTHSDLLLGDRSPEVLDAVFTALDSLDWRWDCLRLSKLLPDNALTTLLPATAAARGWTPRTSYWRAVYYLDLPSSFAEYLAARSAKFRNYARRAEKKLRTAGTPRVVTVTSADAFEWGWQAFLEVERASWKQAEGTSVSADGPQAAMYREWGREAAAHGRLHLQLLLLDDRPIAHNLGCVEHGVYYYLKTSFAAVHRPASPATFLRLALIDSLIAQGISTVDFCGTPYEWEQQWTATYRWQHVVSLYPRTWRGLAFAALDRWAHHHESGERIVHGQARGDDA